LNGEETKIVNIVFNEFNKYRIMNIEKDTLLDLKQKKIDNLTVIEQMRSEQVIMCNTQLSAKEIEIKKLKTQIILFKIATIAGIVTTYFLVK